MNRYVLICRNFADVFDLTCNLQSAVARFRDEALPLIRARCSFHPDLGLCRRTALRVIRSKEKIQQHTSKSRLLVRSFSLIYFRVVLPWSAGRDHGMWLANKHDVGMKTFGWHDWV
jgi:hypothetical protein